jgi:hypothetical protein
MPVPNLLTVREFDDVARQMQRVFPERPSAATEVWPDLDMTLPAGRYDTSFVRQIIDIDAGLLGLSTPDAYAVTLKSAVPVADAIRGFYEVLDRDCPPIIGLETNSSSSFSYYNLRGFTSDLSREQKDHIRSLAARFSGAEHIAIVDQYVASGRTVLFGAHLLHSAGVQNVSAMRGQWYSDALNFNVDTHNLTAANADHQAFMRGMGRLAAHTIDLRTN